MSLITGRFFLVLLLNQQWLLLLLLLLLLYSMDVSYHRPFLPGTSLELAVIIIIIIIVIIYCIWVVSRRQFAMSKKNWKD